jgi:hypothetical protein
MLFSSCADAGAMSPTLCPTSEFSPTQLLLPLASFGSLVSSSLWSAAGAAAAREVKGVAVVVTCPSSPVANVLCPTMCPLLLAHVLRSLLLHRCNDGRGRQRISSCNLCNVCSPHCHHVVVHVSFPSFDCSLQLATADPKFLADASCCPSTHHHHL